VKRVIKHVLTIAAFAAFMALPLAAGAQGIPRGASEGADTGARAAGPVGGAVGGVLGGVAGGVVGGVKGVLGVPQETSTRRRGYRERAHRSERTQRSRRPARTSDIDR
jgi:hypothetical protein